MEKRLPLTRMQHLVALADGDFHFLLQELLLTLSFEVLSKRLQVLVIALYFYA